jgi:hypothetical protein
MGAVVLPTISLVAMAGQVQALEEAPGELAKIKGCERDLCSMVLGRQPKGSDLKCNLSKTWASSSLNGGKSKGISWIFGDARCSTTLSLTRADVVGALTKPKYTIQVPQQMVNCVVERSGETKPVKIKATPKLTFKGGRADKVWLNVKEIDGPEDVKGTVWTAASLEDTLGVFHRPMIKEINKLLYTQCPKRYGPNAKPEDAAATAQAAAGKVEKPAEKALKPAEKKAAVETSTPPAATPAPPKLTPAQAAPAQKEPAAQTQVPPPAPQSSATETPPASSPAAQAPAAQPSAAQAKAP